MFVVALEAVGSYLVAWDIVDDLYLGHLLNKLLLIDHKIPRTVLQELPLIKHILKLARNLPMHSPKGHTTTRVPQIEHPFILMHESIEDVEVSGPGQADVVFGVFL